MHRLSHLVIENFRACKYISIPIESYTPLVGQNNTGKSTMLDAIGWVLKPKPSALKHSDFYDKDASVIISARIDGIDANILEQVPEDNHRTVIEPYCRDGRLWIRVSATGTSANSIKTEVWDVDQCSQEEIPEQWRPYPTGLPQAVAVLLPEPLHVEAMDDIGEDLGKAKAGSTIKALLDELMKPVLEADDGLNQALNTMRQVLTAEGESRSPQLQQFDDSASEVLADFSQGYLSI